MPIAKPLAKKPAVRKKLEEIRKKNQLLMQSSELWDINDPRLKPHPRNPNEGDIDAIRESLAENGAYKPIIWNKRNGLLVAGHHQRIAMRLEGYDKVNVAVIDVPEQRHLKIMLADNATSDRRTYNIRILDEVFETLGRNATGTGFTAMQVEEISQRAAQAAAEALEAAGGMAGGDELSKAAIARSRGGGTIDDEYDDDAGMGKAGSDDSEFEDEAKSGKGIMGASDELAGAFSLKDDMVFDGIGTWGIPRIRTDANLLCTWDDIPDNFRAWAGSATKDWPDADTHWLYNVGIDSTSGMTRDKNGLYSHVVFGFYCHDEYFEKFWWDAATNTTKILNSGITRIIMPDFSMHTPGKESRIVSMWALYRNRWLARYFQEAGMKLIPDVTWATEDPDFLENFILPTLPKKMPLLSIQTQTIDPKLPDLTRKYWDQVQYILDTLKPKDLLIYHGKQGREPMENGTVKFKGRVRFVESRMHALSEKAKGKAKKKTI